MGRAVRLAKTLLPVMSLLTYAQSASKRLAECQKARREAAKLRGASDFLTVLATYTPCITCSAFVRECLKSKEKNLPRAVIFVPFAAPQRIVIVRKLGGPKREKDGYITNQSFNSDLFFFCDEGQVSNLQLHHQSLSYLASSAESSSAGP